jgi:hypothetical protein
LSKGAGGLVKSNFFDRDDMRESMRELEKSVRSDWRLVPPSDTSEYVDRYIELTADGRKFF